MNSQSLQGIEITAPELALAVSHVTENILLFLLNMGAANLAMLDRIQENADNNGNLTGNSKRIVELMLNGVRVSYQAAQQAKA
jgi:hypothetical protein